MTSTRLAIGFGLTTVITTLGWWSATRRIVFLDAMLEAAETEIWSEDGR